MSYEEKLNSIEDELENMTLEDFPEDIIDRLQKEAETQELEFLREKYMENFYWDESGEGENDAREILRDRLIAERFSDEEKAQYQANLHAQRIAEAQKRVAEAQANLDKNAAAIAEAKERNNPKMLAEEWSQRQGRIGTLKVARRELESLMAATDSVNAPGPA